MLNDFEKRIYNEYLRSSRVAAGQPYRLRKNFDDVDPSTELYVKRVSRVLNKFTNMSMQDFFRAPYVVYGAGERFDLKFFTSPRALKTYTLYIQQEVDADPDSGVVMQRVMNSLQFLKEFCVTHQITPEAYAAHQTNSMPTFLVHLKERKISTYVMLELPNTCAHLKKIEADVLKFMFGEKFYVNLNIYKTRYFASKSCKMLVREGLKKIQNAVVSQTQ